MIKKISKGSIVNRRTINIVAEGFFNTCKERIKGIKSKKAKRRLIKSIVRRVSE